MAKTKSINSNSEPEKMMRPALTPDGRENQLISLATDEVERRIRAGTATSQELCHFLKLGTSLARLEKEKLELENELIKSKTKAINSSETSEKLYSEAINAFKKYSGNSSEDEEEYED